MSVILSPLSSSSFLQAAIAENSKRTRTRSYDKKAKVKENDAIVRLMDYVKALVSRAHYLSYLESSKGR